MHILYVDESGSIGNANERYLVLAGVSVFERGIYHLIREADKCVEAFRIGDADSIELHASHIYAGTGNPWRTIRERAQREKMLNSALAVLTGTNAAVRLFAIAVDRTAVAPRDPVEVAFEEICNRFNLFLKRTLNRTGDNQRGLIVMDKAKHEAPLQALATQFRANGARWGHFRHLAEVPLFVDSKASRLVQLADLVAYATWRKYEHKDGRFFDQLVPKFDADGGVVHGLFHYRRANAECFCPACMSRAR